MKSRVLKIALWGFIFIISSRSYSVFAQVAPTAIPANRHMPADLADSIALQEVMISENRLQIPFVQQNRNIQVIDRKQIEALPARSINELLGFIGGVDIRQRGPFGTQADVSVDGGTFEQTLLLVNGIKVLDAQTAHNALNIPIPIDAIERIEVIRGPAARIYGINSLTGAINIVTRKPQQSGLSAHAHAGTGFKQDTANHDALFNARGLQVGGTYALRRQQHALYGGYESGNGYRYNTAFSNQKIYYQGNIQTNQTDELSLMGGYLNNRFGANGFYAAPADKESEEIAQAVLAAISYRSRLSERLSLSPRVSYRYAYDDYRFYRNDLSRARSQHYSHSISTELNGALNTAAGTIGMGAEMRHEVIESSNIGNHTRNNYGLYAEFKTERLRRLLVNAGVYVNYNSDYGWQAFPGIDLGYELSHSWKIIAHTGTGQRIPSFTDLYLDQRPGNLGNPKLLAETAWYAEGGMKYSDERLMAQATYFYRNLSDFIDWVRRSADEPWIPGNFQRNRTHGVTFSANYRLMDGRYTSLSAGVSYTWLAPVFEGRDTGLSSKYAIESLRHQATAHLIFAANKLSVTLAGRFDQRISYSSYFLGDARVAYQFKPFGIYLDAQNIFDATYVEAGAVPMPGRWVSLGVKWAVQQL